jgi:hypothetical protein
MKAELSVLGSAAMFIEIMLSDGASLSLSNDMVILIIDCDDERLRLVVCRQQGRARI